MSKKKHLAWLLLKRRLHMMLATVKEPHRDIIGQLLADLVAIIRYSIFIVTGRLWGPTEIDRRSVVNASRRLRARAQR